MAQLSIDPIQTYYRVAGSLIGRILLYFAAGWSGIFLTRISLGFREPGDLLDWSGLFSGMFDGGWIMELLAMVGWPITAMITSASFSVWLFLPTLLVMAVTFVVFIYTEEPAPAWWIGLTTFVSLIFMISLEDQATWVSWTVLIFILSGLGAAFWWALRVWHPELVESVGALFSGRGGGKPNPAGYSQIRKKAPPGAWGTPLKGWDDNDSKS